MNERPERAGPGDRRGVWLHRYAVLTAAATLFLLVAGAQVTSTGSGLAVPDWPLSYGTLFPPMVGGIFWEHGHRMVAGSVGVLTVVLALWIWFAEDRRWVRGLGLVAVGAVLLQALLGGLTVLFLLPPAVSIAHACLAQTFFCIVVALALFTSRGWRAGRGAPLRRAPGLPLAGLAACAAGAVYVQLLLGAVLRHTHWGLAAHLGGALLVLVTVFWTAAAALRRHGERSELVRPAVTATALVVVQIALGISSLALMVMERGAVQPSILQLAARTSHVVVGAAILATSLVLALRAFRLRAPRGVRAEAGLVSSPGLP